MSDSPISSKPSAEAVKPAERVATEIPADIADDVTEKKPYVHKKVKDVNKVKELEIGKESSSDHQKPLHCLYHNERASRE